MVATGRSRLLSWRMRRTPNHGHGLDRAGTRIRSTHIGHGSVTIPKDRYGHLMPGGEAA
jgi:hypothetical protein